MTQPQTGGDIQVDVGGAVSGQLAVGSHIIQGDVSGQVAMGSHITQIGSFHGILVNPPQAQQPTVRPRPAPIALRPRPMRGFVDRESEVNVVHTACLKQPPVNVHAPAGMGKSSLLRHLAHHLPAAPFPDGILHLTTQHTLLPDLLQSLFDAFFESDTPFKPSPAHIRLALQSKQALVLLDDVGLTRQDIDALLDAAPACTFILASEERCVWGEGQILALGGLPPDAAQALIERELGRPLTPQERPAVQSLHADLKGHPLRLLQTAALAREEGHSLEQVAQALHTPSPPHALANRQLRALSEPQGYALAALAALKGAPLSAEHLAALTGLDDAQPVLDALLRRELLQTHSPSYSISGNLDDMLSQVWDLTSWAEKALAHLTAWAETHRDNPADLSAITPALLQSLAWAMQSRRWPEALRLARAIEGGLILNKQWGAWEQVLQMALAAAQSGGDRAAQAWALHQIGSRALCLGNAQAAQSALAEALKLREALGDQAGAAVTRHNLQAIPKLTAPPQPPSAGQVAPPAGLPWLKAVMILAVVGLVGIAGLGYVLLVPKTTLWVENHDCGELAPDWGDWLTAIPGVELFDSLDSGDRERLRLPRSLLWNAHVTVERGGTRDAIVVETWIGELDFPLTTRVEEVALDGESVLEAGRLSVPSQSEFELVIFCAR